MKRTIVVFLALVAVGECAWAQGLGDAARREKERRAKAGQGDAAAKVVTDEELKNNGGKLANDPSIPPANVLGPPDRSTPTSRRVAAPGSSGSSGAASASSAQTAPPLGGSEATWRSGIRALRESIARLEKEVATLNAKADTLSYGVATSAAPPKINGQPVWVETVDARQAREGSNASAQMGWHKERADVLDRLERAKSSLGKARADLATFEESARRQGVPPGWLRD